MNTDLTTQDSHYLTSVSAVVGYIITIIRNNTLVKKQRDFANLFGLSHTGLAKIERGESSASLDFLFMVTSLIGSSPDELMKITQEILSNLQQNNIIIINHSDAIPMKNKKEGNEKIVNNEYLYGESLARYITTDIQAKIVSLIHIRLTQERIKQLVLEGRLDPFFLARLSKFSDSTMQILVELGHGFSLSRVNLIGLGIFGAFSMKKYIAKGEKIEKMEYE